MTTDACDFSTFDSSTAGACAVATEDVAAVEAAAHASGRDLRRIDLRGCTDKPALLQRIASALAFPEGLGENWDALSDSLRDLSWLPPASGRVLLFAHADELRDDDPDDFDILLDIIDEAIDAWAERGAPMWACFALSNASFDANDD